MKVAWFISLPVLVLVFIFDVHYVNQSKEIRYELYRLEVENLENKKAVAEMTGEVLPDYILYKRNLLRNPFILYKNMRMKFLHRKECNEFFSELVW